MPHAPALVALLFIGDPVPVPLEPSGEWSLRQDATNCEIVRDFGSGPATLSFGIVALPLASRRVINLRFATPVSATYDSPITFRSEPSGSEEHGKVMGFPPMVGKAALLAMYVSQAALRPQTSSVRFTLGKQPLADLAVGDMREPLAQLDKCETAMLRRFGVNVDRLASIATPAEPLNSPTTWFTPDAYPRAALVRGAGGAVAVRFTVQANGKITDCVPVLSSGDQALDEQTCKLVLSRARYRAAIGMDGRPMLSLQFVKTRWQPPSR